MGRLLRSAADRRHERREHGRRRDRRQRRLHATIVRGIARVAAAARRGCAATCGTRVDERGFPGPFGSNPVGIYGGIDLMSRGENSRTAGGASPGHRCSPRASGCRHRRTTTKSKATSSASSTSRKAFSRRGTGRFQSDFTILQGLDLSAGIELQRERAGSTYITGESQAGNPGRPRHRGLLRRRPVGLAGSAVPDGGAAGRGHPARRHRSVHAFLGSPSAAAGRHGRVGQPAARRRLAGSRLGRRLHKHSRRRRHRHPAARRLRALVHRQPGPEARTQRQRRRPASITRSPVGTCSSKRRRSPITTTT